MKNQMQIHDAGGKRLYLTHEHHSEFTRSYKCRSFNKAEDAILNGRTLLIDALIAFEHRLDLFQGVIHGLNRLTIRAVFEGF
jgi:hypothetical protein